MRALLEDPHRGRARTLSSPSFRDATPRPCANSMRAAPKPRSRAMARRWLWGPVSALGLGVAAIVALLDQANKVWMLLRLRHRRARQRHAHPVLRPCPGVEPGHQLRAAAAGRRAWTARADPFALAASLALAVWLASHTSRLAAVAIGLIIGGAIGNAIDRVVYGAVADFFSLHAFGLEWYVFNIADTAIVAGVVGLLYDSLFGGHKKVGNPSKM